MKSEQEIASLVTQAKAGNAAAYSAVVLRLQDMAVAYAYTILGDRHWAEDAAQEAFLEAYLCLHQLREVAAFPVWLRRIVFKHCDRLLRKRRVAIDAPTEVDAVAIGQAVKAASPEQQSEDKEAAEQVRHAIATLPEGERLLVVMFYMSQHSQKQIAEFLDLPLSTVKKRLYTARQKLKEQLIEMIEENFEQQRPSKDSRFAEPVMAFIHQFSLQIDEGQSIMRSLASIAQGHADHSFREVVTAISRDIEAGSTLSEAMQKFPKVFTLPQVAAIRQGEENGNLQLALQQLRMS